MINHVVLFKLKAYSSAEEKKEVLKKMESGLLALKGIIPQLKDIEVGKNYQIDSSSYDLCLITRFDSIADLDIYREHPEHLKVIDFIKKVTVGRAAVDYEL